MGWYIKLLFLFFWKWKLWKAPSNVGLVHVQLCLDCICFYCQTTPKWQVAEGAPSCSQTFKFGEVHTLLPRKTPLTMLSLQKLPPLLLLLLVFCTQKAKGRGSVKYRILICAGGLWIAGQARLVYSDDNRSIYRAFFNNEEVLKLLYRGCGLYVSHFFLLGSTHL